MVKNIYPVADLSHAKSMMHSISSIYLHVRASPDVEIVYISHVV